jgi:selenocysteine lyase/cysteine desulfurase
VRSSLLNELEPPILDQHAAELISPTEYLIRPDSKRFENWEQYCAGKYALGIAIDYALSWGLDAIQQRIYLLADNLRQKLSKLDGIHSTDDGVEKCGIITFTADQLEPVAIKRALSKQRINVSTSKGSGSLVSFQDRGLKEVVRASVHYFNTDEEIDYFVDVLKKIIAR